MRNLSKLALLGLFVSLPALAAVGDGQTISWYMAHTDDRKATIKVCDDDPGHLKEDPDCVNAKKADNQAGVDDVKKGMDDTVQGAADFFHKLGN